MLLTLLLTAAIIAALSSVFIITASLQTGVVPMPSLPSERRLVLEILGNYKDIKNITDLGSGWGGLARSISRRYPGKRVTAVEYSFVPHFFSKLISGLSGGPVTINSMADIFTTTLDDNAAYITYLSGSSMKKLRASFERDQPGNGVLISIAFRMPGWTETRVEHAGGTLRTPVYIYEF
ncbi:MAG: class I SAM-dependent methyltransferase [Spirochaetales bacterium]|uniref:Class I SAM-dependent methyltransferase n=1 Tax=Candidatus Thalassospirochaeta sargassi TaxID=3119039 RepID=A0AAJ1MIM4_9SPIO|nr:class I SAM-dependent methyltransferase [Spirochaetales bacterium]